MDGQDFDLLVKSGLLRRVEKIVVESHRKLYAGQGREWSPPVAYRWLRFEDPEPIARLADSVKKLRRRGAEFESDAVEKACVEASKRGFLN
jgi:hypothetical protein